MKRYRVDTDTVGTIVKSDCYEDIPPGFTIWLVLNKFVVGTLFKTVDEAGETEFLLLKPIYPRGVELSFPYYRGIDVQHIISQIFYQNAEIALMIYSVYTDKKGVITSDHSEG